MKSGFVLIRAGVAVGPVLLLLGAGAAYAQRLGGGSVPEVSIVRIIAALIVCLIVAVLAILFIRHRQGAGLPLVLRKLGSRPSEIELVEARRVSAHAEICLIRHRACEYLLLISPSHSRLLSRRELTDNH